jgi:hypothetical protein
MRSKNHTNKRLKRKNIFNPPANAVNRDLFAGLPGRGFSGGIKWIQYSI